MEQTLANQVRDEHSSGWPSDADFILSTLATASFPELDPQLRGRTPYRVVAQVRALCNDEWSEPIVAYTCDVNSRGLSFITRRLLPMRNAATVQLQTPAGGSLHIDCAIYRCQPVARGWYEGAIAFNSPQPELLIAAAPREGVDSDYSFENWDSR